MKKEFRYLPWKAIPIKDDRLGRWRVIGCADKPTPHPVVVNHIRTEYEAKMIAKVPTLISALKLARDYIEIVHGNVVGHEEKSYTLDKVNEALKIE